MVTNLPNWGVGLIIMQLVTVTGTAGVKESLLGLDSRIAAAEEVSLQTASEGGKRRCRRDVLRQTVPNTGCYPAVKPDK